MSDLIPVGTIVTVTRSDETYAGKVVGYDTFRTKYQIGRRLYRDGSLFADGGSWAFLGEVTLHGVCAFCDIIAGVEPATIVREWQNAIAIVPLNPVVPGHLLVIPRVHVQDFTTDPQVSAGVMWAAAELAVPPANVITSAGREATQSVFHLHAHIVPRAENDGLALPWYSGRTSKRGNDV